MILAQGRKHDDHDQADEGHLAGRGGLARARREHVGGVHREKASNVQYHAANALTAPDGPSQWRDRRWWGGEHAHGTWPLNHIRATAGHKHGSRRSRSSGSAYVAVRYRSPRQKNRGVLGLSHRAKVKRQCSATSRAIARGRAASSWTGRGKYESSSSELAVVVRRQGRGCTVLPMAQ